MNREKLAAEILQVVGEVPLGISDNGRIVLKDGTVIQPDGSYAHVSGGTPDATKANATKIVRDGHSADFFTIQDGETDLDDGALYSLALNTVKTFLIQYKAPDGGNYNGYGNPLTVCPHPPVELSPLSGNLGGTGQFNFTVGPSDKPGLIKIFVTIPALGSRRLTINFG
jgi:hypothetical protein